MRTMPHTEIAEESLNLWHKCAHCNEVAFRGELERNGYICPHCRELFPLSVENRLKLLMDTPEDVPLILSRHQSGQETSAAIAVHGQISGYPVSLFIAAPDLSESTDTSLRQLSASVFSEAITCALERSIPMLSVFTTCPVAEPRKSRFSEITNMLLQVEQLAAASLPYLTILTETEGGPLTVHRWFPIGEIVIAECAAHPEKPPRQHLQPASHAPEEQILQEKHDDNTLHISDISVDCYIPRMELRDVLETLLKFFAPL